MLCIPFTFILLPFMYFAQKLPVPHPPCNPPLLPHPVKYLALLTTEPEQDRETAPVLGAPQRSLQLGHVGHDRVHVREAVLEPGVSLLLLHLGHAGHNPVQGEEVVTVLFLLQLLRQLESADQEPIQGGGG